MAISSVYDEKLVRKRVNLACASLTVFVIVFELLLLWRILSADARAKRQADAVLEAVKSSNAVEFLLLPHPTDPRFQLRQTARVEAIGVAATGRLIPMLSMDTGNLRFDGQMNVMHNASQPLDTSTVLSSPSPSAVPSWSESIAAGNLQEMYVLHDQRGARFSGDEADRVDCLAPAGIPPLFALEAVSGSAFAAHSFASFGVFCKHGRPLEVMFDRSPFVLCALDWLGDLNACLAGNSSLEALDRGQLRHPIYPTVGASLTCTKSPPLVIYGERTVITATLEFGNSIEDANQQTSQVPTRCSLLEAPMATQSLAKLNLLSQILPRPTLRSNTSAESFTELPHPI